LFPCINTLFTVNLYGNIRTGDRAQGAPGTLLPLILEADGAISLGIVLMGRDDQPIAASLNAQMAFLAEFLVYYDVPLQIFRLPIIMLSCDCCCEDQSRLPEILPPLLLSFAIVVEKHVEQLRPKERTLPI
jgi:hypothetical protein